MKKVLALALALCMVLALGTAAFAADITQASDPKSATVIVKTTFEDTDETWTVTIPADIDIPWGDTTAHESTYTITSQLQIGATLTVTAEGSGKLGGVIPYTLAGDVDVTTAGAVVNAQSCKLTATVDSFDGFPIGEYADNVTFTVAYNAPVAP